MTADVMRILTVRQPWAWAIIHGGKDVENRVRNLAGAYRGPVAIHAAGTTVASFDGNHAHLWPFDMQKHVFGKIIGVVDLTDMHQAHEPFVGCEQEVDLNGEGATATQYCSEWAEPDVYHLTLANPQPLPTPIPYRGALGLRRLDPTTIDLIQKELQ